MKQFTKEELKNLIVNNQLHVYIDTNGTCNKESEPLIKDFVLNEMMNTETKTWLEAQENLELHIHLLS